MQTSGRLENPLLMDTQGTSVQISEDSAPINYDIMRSSGTVTAVGAANNDHYRAYYQQQYSRPQTSGYDYQRQHREYMPQSSQDFRRE
jgi:hypothetical protein